MTEPKTTEEDSGSSSDGLYAAENVYGKAKDIFAWTKKVAVVSFFSGMSEEVAGKALGAFGTDLPTVDKCIKTELHKLDGNVLNPAVDAIVQIAMNVGGKTEEFVKPIILNLVSPFKMVKSKAMEKTPADATEENPEVVSAPKEGTSPPTTTPENDSVDIIDPLKDDVTADVSSVDTAEEEKKPSTTTVKKMKKEEPVAATKKEKRNVFRDTGRLLRASTTKMTAGVTSIPTRKK